MTPDSYIIQTALTLGALLLAGLGALLLFKEANEEAAAPSLDLTDAGIRIGDGADVLRFRVEMQPTGSASFRAETRRAARA